MKNEKLSNINAAKGTLAQPKPFYAIFIRRNELCNK